MMSATAFGIGGWLTWVDFKRRGYNTQFSLTMNHNFPLEVWVIRADLHNLRAGNRSLSRAGGHCDGRTVRERVGIFIARVAGGETTPNSSFINMTRCSKSRSTKWRGEIEITNELHAG